MEKMKKLVALLLVLTMVLGLAVTASAVTIADTRNSVVVIGFGIDHSTNSAGEKEALSSYVHSGTGFFVGVENEDPTYIITNYHVIRDFLDYYGAGALMELDASLLYGDAYKGRKIPVRAKVWVSYDEKEREEGYVVYADEGKDFAILKLAKPTSKRDALKLRIVEDSMVGDAVYAVGYPGLAESMYIDAVDSMNIQDATVTQGTLGRIVLESGVGIKHIQSDCAISGGNSGGPLVDRDGNVLGITTQHIYNSDADKLYYSVSIDEIIPFLRMYGVDFELADSSPAPVTEPTPTEPAVTEPATTEAPAVVDTMALEEKLEDAAGLKAEDYEDFSAVNTAVKKANKALTGSQADVDKALEELSAAMEGLVEKKDPMPMIIAGAAVLLVVIVAVVVISSKKKKVNPPVKEPVAAPQPAPQPATAQVHTATNVGETAILTADTDILVNGGTLLRVKNGQRIIVNAVEFVMGREAASCAFCILDNNAVGRTHAKIVVRGDKTFLVDMKSRNGTYLNGVRVNPQEENELKNGDRIRLASEEFEFQK